jgi:hypothetical protein
MAVVHDNTLRYTILVRTPRRPDDRRDRVTVLQTLETTPSSRNSLCLWHKQSEREFFGIVSMVCYGQRENFLPLNFVWQLYACHAAVVILMKSERGSQLNSP